MAETSQHAKRNDMSDKNKLPKGLSLTGKQVQGSQDNKRKSGAVQEAKQVLKGNKGNKGNKKKQ